MSPVSIDRSFSRTRCTTESVFLNTTVWPATSAGFGENDWAPRSPTMLIVTGPAGVGDEGVDPPPPQPAAPANARTSTPVAMTRIDVPLSAELGATRMPAQLRQFRALERSGASNARKP